MYSDAYFFGGRDDDGLQVEQVDREVSTRAPDTHIDLPTMLPGRSLSIDISRWGRWITVKINGVTTVKVVDIIAKDGVIHELDDLLLPFKLDENEELTVDKFKAHFDEYYGEL